jgi:transitional endoplasmic reticulum ATPase
MVRLGRQALRELAPGEERVVEIAGKRATAALALELHDEDGELDIIRLDGLQRSNAGVSIGDLVTVGRAAPLPAIRIVLAPPTGGLPVWGTADVLRRSLLGRVLLRGDVVVTSIHHGASLAGRTAKDSGKAADGETGVSSTVARGAREAPAVPRVAGDEPVFGFGQLRLCIAETEPSGVVQVSADTIVSVQSDGAALARGDVTYDDIGGLDDTIKQVREMIELPLKHPRLFRRLGIEPPKGVLLYGPPGTGKTLLAKAVANEADARFFYVGGPEVVGSYQGESEERLRTIFQQAQEHAPAVIFLDEIDSLAPKREAVRGETERRIVAQLLTLMDGLEPRRNVIVMGATNLVDTIDEALRRPGRFDREIAVRVPDRQGRRALLGIHTRGMPLSRGVDLDRLARTTHGFVGADVAALAREAAIEAVRRVLPDINIAHGEIPAHVVEGLEVTAPDFDRARKRVQPSAMRELLIEVPDVTWADLGGVEDAMRTLREGIELPLRNPEAFRRLGVRPARGFLLFGPPGTGKTMLAKAVAHEAEANFIGVNSSGLLSKWYGESEQQLARLFARARQVAPAVIFIDEIDSLAPQRGGEAGEPAVTERVVNTLLAEMDGLRAHDGVVVIGATNRPALLDTALLRPGRFDELVYVPVPDRDGRLHILRVHTAKMPLADDVDLASIAAQTAGYTGADLEGVVRRAGLQALRSQPDMERVPMACFDSALAESHASVTPEMEREYVELLEELKRESPKGRRKIGFVRSEQS